MAFDGMSKVSSKIPQEIFSKVRYTCLKYMKTNINTLYSISETDRIMNENGFLYMIIKGLSSASYYPDPNKRMLGDVDFLIENDKKENVMISLEKEGYTNLNSLNNHHVVYLKENQDLEMHFDFPGLPKDPLRKIAKDFLDNSIYDVKTIDINGGTYNINNEKYHGLILLLHMQQHMLSEGIGLRHLMDWCCYMNKTGKESFWECELLPIIQSLGLLKYAKVLTKTCNIYFNLDLPSWCKNFDNPVCDEIMEDILKGGNFGRKNKARSTGGLVISDNSRYGKDNGKIHALFKVMLSGVNSSFPVVVKYPFLYPVFIPLYAVKRLFRVITGKRVPLYQSLLYADERKNIYDKLDIFK